MHLVLSLYVSQVVVFVVSACQQMLNFTELDCDSLVGLQIEGFIHLTESTLADESYDLVAFVENGPALFAEVAALLLRKQPLLLQVESDLVLCLFEVLFEFGKLPLQKDGLE